MGRNRFWSPPENAPRGDLVDDFLQDRIAVVVVARVVAAALELHDLLDGEAEEEEVFSADFFADFDVGSVERADGERTVHGELHVAGAGGFLAGGGNLLGKVGGGIDHLSALDVEVGDEDHAQKVAHRVVGIDGGGDGVDQLDDELGHEVAGGGLAAEDDGARRDRGVGIVLDAVVER